MFKRIYACILILLISFNFVPISVYAKGEKDKVLIVYDRENIFSFNNNIVSSVDELLGAFNVSSNTTNILDYKTGDIFNYDYVFIIGIDGDLNNEIFLRDLKQFNKKIVWIGKGMENLLNVSEKYGLRHIGTKRNIIDIYYGDHNKTNINEEKKMERILLKTGYAFDIYSPPKEAKILSLISDGEKKYPFIINEKNLWYISYVEDDSVLFYIFADVLNDIFEMKRPNGGKVFVRIEDVHPFRDPKKLKEIADYLYGEGIPFMVALIPTYINPKTGYATKISEVEEFREAIKYMQDKGGSIVLHGYTHSNRKEEASGEGYEFWDGEMDKPLNVDMESYVYKKVGDGVLECVKNGIYPLAFEAPHYAMDYNGYKEIRKYFSTYVGQFQSNNEKFTTTPFPYILYDTKSFNKLIPENLGFVDEEDEVSIEKIKDNFNKISVVRGYTAGFFFHNYLDIDYLKELISFLKSKDVEFFNLKDEENWVKWDDIYISSSNGQIDVKGDIKTDLGKEEKQNDGYIGNINRILIFVISIFCVIFIVIIISSKKIDKEKYTG